MKRLLVLTAAALAILISSCGSNSTISEATTRKVEAGEAMPVSGDDYEGLTAYDEQVSAGLGEGEPFMPSKADIQSFESKLAADGMLEVDPKEEVVEWRRYYAGSSFEGERRLYVVGDCKEQPQGVEYPDDGGTCYWQARFNLNTEDMRFAFNGEA